MGKSVNEPADGSYTIDCSKGHEPAHPFGKSALHRVVAVRELGHDHHQEQPEKAQRLVTTDRENPGSSSHPPAASPRLPGGQRICPVWEVSNLCRGKGLPEDRGDGPRVDRRLLGSSTGGPRSSPSTERSSRFTRSRQES